MAEQNKACSGRNPAALPRFKDEGMTLVFMVSWSYFTSTRSLPEGNYFFSLVILVTATKWMMAYSPSLNVQRSPSPCIDLEFKQHSLLIEDLFSSSEH